MPACSAQRSHSHWKIMYFFRTLGSRSLSVTAMLTFSVKANTSIHGFGDDDTATWTIFSCHTCVVYAECFFFVCLFFKPLISIIFVFNPFYYNSRPNHCYWERNVCLNTMICIFSRNTNSTNMSNLHLLKVVGRGSETQLQAGKN